MVTLAEAITMTSPETPDVEKFVRRFTKFMRNRGLEVSFPVSTEQVLQAFMRLGYDVTPRRIAFLINQARTLDPPARRRRDFCWSPGDVLNLLAECERRRWFIPSSKIHRHKFSLAEWGRLAETDQYRSHVLEQLSQWSVAELLDSVEEANGARERTGLTRLLRMKLKDNAERGRLGDVK